MFNFYVRFITTFVYEERVMSVRVACVVEGSPNMWVPAELRT